MHSHFVLDHLAGGNRGAVLLEGPPVWARGGDTRAWPRHFRTSKSTASWESEKENRNYPDCSPGRPPLRARERNVQSPIRSPKGASLPPAPPLVPSPTTARPTSALETTPLGPGPASEAPAGCCPRGAEPPLGSTLAPGDVSLCGESLIPRARWRKKGALDKGRGPQASSPLGAARARWPGVEFTGRRRGSPCSEPVGEGGF